MSYMQLICIIVISNNVHLTYKFLCDFIQQITKSAFSPIFRRNSEISAIYNAMFAKIISILSCKISIFHAKFCTFPCNRIQSRATTKIWGKTEQQRPLLSHAYPKYIIVIYNSIYFGHTFLCNFILKKLRSAYSLNFGKNVTTAPRVSDFHQKQIDISLCLNNTKYQISLNSVDQFWSYTSQ